MFTIDFLKQMLEFTEFINFLKFSYAHWIVKSKSQEFLSLGPITNNTGIVRIVRYKLVQEYKYEYT